MLDKGIEAQPSDPVLHEFRALCEFALGNYRQAAAGIYNVLSAGPGWDWTTLVNLYPSVETYTSQLRALEEYVRLNPAAPDARFLLAYHYLVQGYDGAAGQQFREVMRLEPTNAVAAQLLQSMSNPSATLPPAPELEASGPNASAAQPAASQNSPQSAATRSAAQAALAETGVPAVATSAAIDPKLLVGHWSATGPAGSKFVLDLTPDHKFAWQFDRQGQSTAIRGTYKLVGDDLLALEGDNENNLVARIRFDAEHGMNFKLAGSGATDPGLTFVQ
jgi:uncharacterized protein (TIGR03066 family)